MNYLGIFAIAASGILAQHRDLRVPRRLSVGAPVCVNQPLNLSKLELDPAQATRDLAAQIREAGFAAEPIGVLETCEATVYTEIVSVNRKTADLEFRVVFADEQIPRLCTSIHSRSVLAAFVAEAKRIRDAEVKGMPIYPGAIE